MVSAIESSRWWWYCGGGLSESGYHVMVMVAIDRWEVQGWTGDDVDNAGSRDDLARLGRLRVEMEGRVS